jgi:hypothetical protein
MRDLDRLSGARSDTSESRVGSFALGFFGLLCVTISDIHRRTRLRFDSYDGPRETASPGARVLAGRYGGRVWACGHTIWDRPLFAHSRRLESA